MDKRTISLKIGMAIHKITTPMPEEEVKRIKPMIKEIEECVIELMEAVEDEQ